MKKVYALLVSLTLFLSACSTSPAGDAYVTTGTPEVTGELLATDPTANKPEDSSAIYEGLMTAVTMPLIVETCTEENGKPIAYYTHQDIQITLPDADVAQVIRLDLLNRIDASRSDAESLFEKAKSNYKTNSTWYPYSFVTTFSPARLDQNVLSFFVFETSFDASPRTSQNLYSLNYDLATGDVLNLVTIFHEENYTDAICDLLIENMGHLDQDSLFADYEDIVRSMFYTNTTVDSWYFTDTGLCFFFAPYEVAPYASGVVTVEINYEALSGLLKDKYFPGEKLNYNGTLEAQVLTADSMAVLDQYSQFAHVTLEAGTKQFLVTAQGSVSNIRINYACDPDTGITESTVLLMPGMGPGDAILLDVSANTAADKITITYESGGQTHTFYFSK